MTKTIDISNWENFDKLHKAQMEMEAQTHLLNYFIDNNVPVEDSHYQNAERRYINAYFELFDIKNTLTVYLMGINELSDGQSWLVDFGRKTVDING